MRAARQVALAWLGSVALSGCIATAPRVDVVEPTQVRPSAAAYVAPTNGSIFQGVAYRPLYETHRARMVGDIITVTISENISAKQESTSQIEKKGSVSSTVSAAPFIRSDQLLKLNATGSSDNKLDGKGSTASSNVFTGTITTTVVEVLANGHLVISGEKQIGVTNNVDRLRFSGQVDPMSVQPGNVVLSTQIANVRIEQMGRGAGAEANQIGWLARFFLNILPI
ncbi:flagellar basal body L-ring protein FlgH [Aquabacterium sp.]|jgi:flagellar L-ring protein precursor FlgH|uniref:flagellar basal body L-ring protein FlgH n=1 Tax=Aquabacterium sp. TaxID=1872578 RepID=UPI0025B7B839|nr:flagellar basal body L-ring protein FlgH [Aquabacterium sp.]